MVLKMFAHVFLLLLVSCAAQLPPPLKSSPPPASSNPSPPPTSVASPPPRTASPPLSPPPLTSQSPAISSPPPRSTLPPPPKVTLPPPKSSPSPPPSPRPPPQPPSVFPILEATWNVSDGTVLNGVSISGDGNTVAAACNEGRTFFVFTLPATSAWARANTTLTLKANWTDALYAAANQKSIAQGRLVDAHLLSPLALNGTGSRLLVALSNTTKSRNPVVGWDLTSTTGGRPKVSDGFGIKWAQAPNATATSVAFAPAQKTTGRVFWSALFDAPLSTWTSEDVDPPVGLLAHRVTGTLQNNLTLSSGVFDAAFGAAAMSSDGLRLAVMPASSGATLWVYTRKGSATAWTSATVDVATAVKKLRLGSRLMPDVLGFSSDSRLLIAGVRSPPDTVTGAKDRLIIALFVMQSTTTYTFHSAYVDPSPSTANRHGLLALSDDNTLLMTFKGTGGATVWKVAAQTSAGTPAPGTVTPFPGGIRWVGATPSLATGTISDDGSRVIMSSNNGTTTAAPAGGLVEPRGFQVWRLG